MPQAAAFAVAAIKTAGAYLATASAATAAGTATLAQTFAVVAANVALSAGVTAAGKLVQPKVQRSGTAIEWTADADAPLHFAFGRVGVAGQIVHNAVFGPDSMYVGFVNVFSAAGPIDGYEGFTADDKAVAFDGAGKAVTTEYANVMWRRTQVGAQPTPTAMSIGGLKNGASMPNWGGSSRLNGKAAELRIMGENSKKSAYGGKVPTGITTLRGLRCWDPRLDSTYPGGLGTCRLNNPLTWVYSTNAWLHGLKWSLGLWEGPTGKGAPQVDYQVGGIGAKVEGIDVAAYVEGANLFDARSGWACAAWPSTDDDKAAVLDSFLQAGGGLAAQKRGRLSAVHRIAPRASVATITGADTAGPIELTLATPRKARINTLRPQYWSETHKWQMAAAGEVTSATWQTEDGGRKRSRPVDYNYVPNAQQAAELAALQIAHTREGIKGVIPLRSYMDGLEVGDCITLNEPDFVLNGLKVLILDIDDQAETDVLRVSFISETDAKYPFAYGQTSVPPPAPTLTPRDLTFVDPPQPDDWSVIVRPPAPGGGQVPAFDLTGLVTNATATGILVEWWQVPEDDLDAVPDALSVWATAYSGPATATSIPITGVDPGATYFLAVSNLRGQSVSARTIYGPYLAPDLVAAPVDLGPLIGRIDAAEDLVAANDARVDALYDEFGDIVDAAESAEAAAASATAAAAAEAAAILARGEAQGAADDAEAEAILAASRATAAAASATAAGTSASAAAGSASTASSAATAAGSSATAAQASRVASESARDAASGSASASATSATSAATAATNAANSATASQTSRLASESARDVASGHASAASTSATTASTAATTAGNAATASQTARLASEAASGTAGTHAAAALTSANAASASATAAGASASTSTAQRLLAEAAREGAETAATASAASASTAAASATAAGSSASASDTARIAAQTAQGAAESARTTAVTASETATTAAGTATTQAGLAAGSATAAGGSATAAAGSASSASTSADQAGNSASAASGSEVRAASAAGNAAFLDAFAVYRFNNSADGWTTNGTLTTAADGLTLTQSVSDTMLNRSLSFPGSRFTRVIIDLERTANRTSGAWDGTLYYSTSGHGISSSYRKAVAYDPPLGERREVTFDMAALTTGGADWLNSTITGLRLDLDSGASGAFKIHSIRVVGVDATAPATAAAAAVVSASNAATSATAAGTSATAASGSATSAGTAAGNASTFAGQSSTSATNAANSASDAAGSAITAGTAASTATGAAGTATTQASNASASATSAQQSSTVAASLGTGAGFVVDPVFQVWPTGQALPTGVAVAAGSPTATREAGAAHVYVGGFAFRTAVTAASAAHSAVMRPVPVNVARIVVDYQFRLNSGDLRRAAIDVVTRQNNSARYAAINLFSLHPSPTTGRLYSGSVLLDFAAYSESGADYSEIRLHHNLAGAAGGSFSAKDISWQKVQIRAATPEEITANTVIPSLQASVTQHALAITDLEDQNELARFEVAAVTGGGAAILRLQSTAYGTVAGLLADEIYFGPNTVFDDATDQLRTTFGTDRRVIALGASFGGASSLTEWKGLASVPYGSETKANAKFYQSDVAPFIGGAAFDTATTNVQFASGNASITRTTPASTLATTTGIASAGSYRVEVAGSARVDTGAAPGAQLILYRVLGGVETELSRSNTLNPTSPDDPEPFTILPVGDTPGAGTVSYRVKVVGSGGPTFSGTTLVAATVTATRL